MGCSGDGPGGQVGEAVLEGADMQVAVTARHVQVTPALRGHAEDRARRLERTFDPIRKVEVILVQQGGRFFEAEVIVSAVRGVVLVSSSMDVSATAAVDAAAGKMDRQLRKFKEKVRRRHVGIHRALEPEPLQSEPKLAD